MELNNISIKFFAQSKNLIKPSKLINIFHSWIQQQKIRNHLLIDVADYSHVPNGPGVLLVAHEGNYSATSSNDEMELLYQSKRNLAGSITERLSSTINNVQHAIGLLEMENELQPNLKFNQNYFQVIMNDRLNFENTEPSFESLRPALTEATIQFFGHEKFNLKRQGGPKERLCVSIETTET